MASSCIARNILIHDRLQPSTRLLKRAEGAATGSPNLVFRSVLRCFKYVGSLLIRGAKDSVVDPPEAFEGSAFIDTATWIGITALVPPKFA